MTVETPDAATRRRIAELEDQVRDLSAQVAALAGGLEAAFAELDRRAAERAAHLDRQADARAAQLNTFLMEELIPALGFTVKPARAASPAGWPCECARLGYGHGYHQPGCPGPIPPPSRWRR